jgi:2-phosphoglycolate phosphatase
MDEDAYRKKFSTECMDLLQVAISYLNPISRFRQKAYILSKVVGAYRIPQLSFSSKRFHRISKLSLVIMNYILDLDGTLMDTIEDLGNAINHAFRTLGFPIYSKEMVKTFVGNGSESFVIKSLGEHGQNKFEKVYEIFSKFYKEHCTDNAKPYPGVLEFLKKNSGKVALLTNKPIEQTLSILGKFNLERHFTCILGGDTAPERKPNPSGILKIIEDSKWNQNETIMVGDDIPDIGAARAAGIRVAIILNGFGKANELLELKPDYAFKDFEEFAVTR